MVEITAINLVKEKDMAETSAYDEYMRGRINALKTSTRRQKWSSLIWALVMSVFSGLNIGLIAADVMKGNSIWLMGFRGVAAAFCFTAVFLHARTHLRSLERLRDIQTVEDSDRPLSELYRRIQAW